MNYNRELILKLRYANIILWSIGHKNVISSKQILLLEKVQVKAVMYLPLSISPCILNFIYDITKFFTDNKLYLVWGSLVYVNENDYT